ncbi:MAG: TetR family transcriptional regulator [Myxococcota bacterium]
MARSRRGRPHRGSEIDRERWLQSAVAVLDERRRGKFTLEAVAERVGASPMALYRHFDGRDPLVDALVDRILVLPPLPDAADPEAVLESDIIRHSWLAPFLLEGRATRTRVLSVSERTVTTLLQHAASAMG